MKNTTISHSKYKNTGILFELLTRQITSDILTGNSNSPAVSITKKYFNGSTELGKELQLYRSLFDHSALTETKAIHLIDLVLDQYKTLNQEKLSKEKYRLVKEIKTAYDLKKFLSHKIPDYVIHASIYKTLLTESTDNSARIMNISEVATAKFTLIEYLTGNLKRTSKENAASSVLLKEFKDQTEELRLLSYKILIDKFNSKYSTLNEFQKSLLKEYINNVTNSNSLKEYVVNEIPNIKMRLEEIANITSERVTKIKLTEVSSQLDNISKVSTLTDSHMVAILIAYEIIKELEE